MTLTVSNATPVNLTGTISSSTLGLHHGVHALVDHDNSLFAELPETGPIDETEIVVTDFTVNGNTHKVYAWEANATGGVVQWTRVASGGSSSGLRSDMPETDVLVVAVPPGVSVPDPGSTSGPPAPGTSQTVVKVKVRKQGSMPIG
ncbi:MAG: hypothetical protein ACPG4T_15070 [Nannocystaceae bacterium]